MKRTCKQCGKEFELSESEISFYKSKGLELPKRCKSCREKNKGHNSQTEQKPKMASTSQSSQNNQSNHENHNKNDKSRIVVSAVAVLLVLLVFVIKGVFAVPSERVLVSEDVASADIRSKQEVPQKAPSEVPDEETTVEAAANEQQQVESAEHETENQTEEQIPQKADVQTQPETPNEAPDEVGIAATTTTIEAVPETANAAYRFRKPEYLTAHFQKHGAEFPYATEEEYLLGANNVIQNPNALHKLEAEDGDDVYYVEDTREFVVVSTDGYIRTYFTTSLDYYNRQ